MPDQIFAGLKVLDCASFIAAPAAATILSDFGADVIKVEPPGAGDPYRRLSSLPGYPVSEHNYCWLLESRNKRSLALDLTQPQGRAVLYRLVEQTDVRADQCHDLVAALRIDQRPDRHRVTGREGKCD